MLIQQLERIVQNQHVIKAAVMFAESYNVLIITGLSARLTRIVYGRIGNAHSFINVEKLTMLIIVIN